MSSATDLARLRRIWPAIVRAKGGWPPEPVGVIDAVGALDMTDPRATGPGSAALHPWPGIVPDLTLPGTRAAVLAWLGLPTFRIDLDGPILADEHTAATALAAIERWAKEYAA